MPVLHGCVPDSGSQLSTLFSQPYHQPADPHTNPFGLCRHHPYSHTSGLTHGRGRGCSGGLCSGYFNTHVVSKYISGMTETYIQTHISTLFFKGPRRNLRNDLLIAADSITNTMSSLVKELNSGKNEQ